VLLNDASAFYIQYIINALHTTQHTLMTRRRMT